MDFKISGNNIRADNYHELQGNKRQCYSKSFANQALMMLIISVHTRSCVNSIPCHVIDVGKICLHYYLRSIHFYSSLSSDNMTNYHGSSFMFPIVFEVRTNSMALYPCLLSVFSTDNSVYLILPLFCWSLHH